MTTNKAAPYVRYKGILYQLHTGGGLGSTRESRNFTLIENDYPSDTRELRFEDGAFVLIIGLKFPSKGPYKYTTTLFIEAEEAAELFKAMMGDGGKVGRGLKAAWQNGLLPKDFAERALQTSDSPKELPEPQQATGSTRYPKQVVALLRGWEGERMVRVPPDEEVATVIFNVCPAGGGFSLGGYEMPDATAQEVDAFSHELHIELTRRFPEARIDTSVVDGQHCGYPIVLNVQKAEVHKHMGELSQLAFQIWRGIYRQR